MSKWRTLGNKKGTFEQFFFELLAIGRFFSVTCASFIHFN